MTIPSSSNPWLVSCPCNGEIPGCLGTRVLTVIEHDCWQDLDDDSRVQVFHDPETWIREFWEFQDRLAAEKEPNE